MMTCMILFIEGLLLNILCAFWDNKVKKKMFPVQYLHVSEHTLLVCIQNGADLELSLYI